MIKKVVMAVSSLVLAGAFVFVSGVDTKAALYCTYDIIDTANGDIGSYEKAYQQAKANEAAALAAFNAVKADPNHSQLLYEQAAYDYNNAVNVSKWYLTMYNNAKDYLKNIKSREAFEDKFAYNRAQLADLTKLQAAKADADNATALANGYVTRINEVEKALAGYVNQAKDFPSLQPQVDQLTNELNTLKAEYAKQAAVASEKTALYDTYVKTLNYQDYSVNFEHYQHDREWFRDDENWSSKGYYWGK